MVAGSNPARGAKIRFIFNVLLALLGVTRDAARSVSQPRFGRIRQNRVQADVCGSAAAATRTAPKST
jgi:hypothetical protein